MLERQYRIVRIEPDDSRHLLATCADQEAADEMLAPLVAQNSDRRYDIEIYAPKRQGPVGWLTSRRRRWRWIAAALAIAYPLSLGPLALIYDLFGNPVWLDRAAEVVYFPLFWVTDYFGVTIFRWYLHLWRDLAG